MQNISISPQNNLELHSFAQINQYFHFGETYLTCVTLGGGAVSSLPFLAGKT